MVLACNAMLPSSVFAKKNKNKAFENPFTGESKWVDVSVVHTTSASYVSKEFKHVVQRTASASSTMDKMLSELLLSDPSPVVMERVYKKNEKYSRLVLAAKKQVLEKKRTSCPSFVPFLLSDTGEFSPSALDLIGGSYRRTVTKSALPLGRMA